MVCGGWFSRKNKTGWNCNLCNKYWWCKRAHDKIRKEGSFEKDLLALKKLKYHGVQTMVATTINNENIEELDEMYDIFSE